MTSATALQVEVPEQRQCSECGGQLPEPKKRGAPRIYCSDRCRTKAFATNNRPRRRPTSRRPLPEFAKESGWALRKDVERMERIFADDRFALYKPQVAAHVRGHLEYAAEVCQDLLSRLNANQTGE